MSDDSDVLQSDSTYFDKVEPKDSFVDLLKKKSTGEIEAAISRAFFELTGQENITCNLESIGFNWDISLGRPATSSSISLSVRADTESDF